MIGLMFAAGVLLLDALSILDVFSGGRDIERKAIWIAIIILLPLAGPILYYLLTRRGPIASAKI